MARSERASRGDAWDSAIRKQIKSCALFIPIISANTHARIEGYFRLEWKLALDRSHLLAPDQAFIVPVAIDNTPQSDERLPDRFRELQWTRLPDGNTPPGVFGAHSASAYRRTRQRRKRRHELDLMYPQGAPLASTLAPGVPACLVYRENPNADRRDRHGRR